MSTIQDLEQFVAAIERQGANIAPSYQEYMPMAFAIANEFGETGRSFFHRLCRLSEKYRPDEADKLFEHALRSGKGQNGFGSLFHLARQAGVRLDKPTGERPADPHANLHAATAPSPTPARIREEAPDETPEEAADPLPSFPAYGWPTFLARIIERGDSPAQRDILLLGALTVLGATLNRRLRLAYGGKYHYPCLQTFVVAPPASGKGALTWVRRLAEPFHEEMLARYRERLQTYRREKTAWDLLGKQRAQTPEPEEPRLRMFLISGNNSGTGILENLIDADGVGLICEAEADTVSAAIGTDYGHWSDTLRKCHDHDRLSFNRRTNHEYRECDRSFLGVLLSGTPAQVAPLIPSAENGLFSRQLFYRMPAIEEWMDQFDRSDDNLDRLFLDWGRRWKRLTDALWPWVNVVQLRLSDAQKQLFNQRLSRFFSHAGIAGGGAMRSTVARIAINTCRMTAIVAFLRAVDGWLSGEEEPTDGIDTAAILRHCPGLTPAPNVPRENIQDGIVPAWTLTVTDADLEAVLALAETLYRHSLRILRILPATDAKIRQAPPKEALFEALPLEFTRKQALDEAARLKIATSTLESYLRRMRERGLLLHDDKGAYRFAARVKRIDN